MSLTFDTFTFRGLFSAPDQQEIPSQRIEEVFFGQHGSRELWGQETYEDIRFTWVVDDSFANAAAVRQHIADARALRGVTGTLTYVDAAETFTRYNTILRDLIPVSGPLEPTGTASGWWARYELVFRCLRP